MRRHGRETLHTETLLANPHRVVRHTTLPFDPAWPVEDRGVITVTTYPDGTLLKVGGSAARPRRYVHGASTPPGADPGLHVTELYLDAQGMATAETVTRHLDFLGRVSKLVYADAAEATFGYDQQGRLVRETDPDGVQHLHAYDERGQRVLTALDLNRDGQINLDGTDRVMRITSRPALRAGAPVRRTTTEVWATPGVDAPLEVAVEESALNALESWTTRRGLTTHAQIDFPSDGERAVTATYPDGTVRLRHYLGRRLARDTLLDADAEVIAESVYAHDALGRLVVSSDQLPVGAPAPALNAPEATTYTYHPDGRLHTLTTPAPDVTNPGDIGLRRTTYTHDAAGCLVTVAHPDGTHTHATYWPSGQLRRTWGARTYPQAYTYDAQGRLLTLTTWQDFAGEDGVATTTWHYHPLRGWLVGKDYPDAQTGQPAPNSGPTYTHTPAGRVATRTWARTVGGSPLVTTYGYNDAGDLAHLTYSDATPSVHHTHDRLGRVARTVDAAGQLDLDYSPESGRLIGETYTGSGLLSGRTVARAYDSLQRPAALATDSGYALAYDYDSTGRLHQVQQGFHHARYAYAPRRGDVAAITLRRVGVERVRHQREFDDLGRVVRVETTSSPTVHVRRDLDYNPVHQRTGVMHEDGRRWAYDYDELGQVVTGQKRLADNVTPLPGHTFGYDFDSLGNRRETTTQGRVSTYTVDLLNQPTARTAPGAVDVRGEALTDAVVTVDSLPTTRTGKDFYREILFDNTQAAVSDTVLIEATLPGEPPESVQVTRSVFLSQTPETFVHDADGNLVQDGRWDYTWDAENRLTAMQTRASIATAHPELNRRLEFAYDAQGRRIAKRVLDWDTSTSTFLLNSETKFLYDGWNLITEENLVAGSWELGASYVWGLDLSGTRQGAGGAGGLLWANTPTHTFAPTADANGNVVAWINTATKVVSGRVDYGPFGEVVQRTGVAVWLPYGFSTKYEDPETGHLYYGYRYYAPSRGGWLNRDPAGETGGLNLYGMVGNDPVNFWDYLGLQADSIGFLWTMDAPHRAQASWYQQTVVQPGLAMHQQEQRRLYRQQAELSLNDLQWATNHQMLNALGFRNALHWDLFVDEAFDAAVVTLEVGSIFIPIGGPAVAPARITTRCLPRVGGRIGGGASGGLVGGAGGGAGNALKDVLPVNAAETTAARTTSAWTRAEVNGSRVYQRTDLIDPARVDALGRTNVQRMQSGLAPLGPDGKSMNLHHMLQTANGPLAEMTQTFHKTNHRIIHINPNTIPSGINRPVFDAWRGDYWKIRATDFIE